MASIWLESVGRNLETALALLAVAVRDCPDGLWEQPMWHVPALGPEHQFIGADWTPITDAVERNTLSQRWVERRSTPWSVAWHALETFDYDLNGEFGPWAPPPPFTGHPHWRDLASLPAAWARTDVLGYIEYCRVRSRETLAGMTEEQAATPLPQAHRYSGEPYGSILLGMVGHTTEHAAQIRQFVATSR